MIQPSSEPEPRDQRQVELPDLPLIAVATGSCLAATMIPSLRDGQFIVHTTRMRRMLELGERYDHFLLDAFGVLVHTAGALPGAREFLATLAKFGKSFGIVTNDSSRLPESAAERFCQLGFSVTPDDVFTSGSLIASHFAANDLVGATCMVLGPKDSEIYVERAGGVVAPVELETEYDAIVCCDDAGYPFLGTLDTAMSSLFRLISVGRPPALILPNPDIIYNKNESSYGFTAGAAAMLLEAAVTRRFPQAPLYFERLGKPEPALFEAALGHHQRARTVMIGDQLETDIVGAAAAGLDSVLLESGIASEMSAGAVEPTHRLPSLEHIRLGRD